MNLDKQTGFGNRALAGILADIAHDLSSVTDWEARVLNVLSLTCDAVRTDVVALGLQSPDGWKTYSVPETQDADELADTLLEHYSIVTGQLPQADDSSATTNLTSGAHISESGDYFGSFLSIPVIGAEKVLGILHVSTDIDEAYSREDVSVLSVIAMMIGAFTRAVQSHQEEEGKNKELKRLSEEAQWRKAELESLIESMADGVSLSSVNGTNLMMNEAGRRLLGIPPGEPLAKLSDYERWTLDGDPIALEETASARALKGEAVKDFRFKVRSPWGKESLICASASPVHDSSGRVVGSASVFRDISEELDLEQRKQELFEREHNIAIMLQQALIPPKVNYEIEGLNIAVKYQPAMKEAEVGGDFYDVFDLRDGRIGILIGDVAGKGLPAAIRVAAARYAIRSYAYLNASPGVVMTLVNEALCRDETEEGAFLTAVFAVIDTKESTMTYASGGHEPPLLRNAAGEVDELTNGGQALGVSCGYTYSEASRKIKHGDTLVIVTDGITEARSGGKLFDIEGVKQFLRKNRNIPPRKTASDLLKAATRHANGTLQDDAAIIVLELA